MKQKFSLSTTNYLVLFVLVLALLRLHFVEAGFSADEELALMAGKMVGLFLLSSLISWCVWLFSGRMGNSSSWAFNIAATILVFIFFNPVRGMGGYATDVKILTSEPVAGKKNATETENRGNAAERVATGLLSKIQGLFSSHSGTEEGSNPETESDTEIEIHRIMEAFTGEFRAVRNEWEEAHKFIESKHIPDYELLQKEEQEYGIQRQALLRHIKASQAYIELINQMVPTMEKRYRALGVEHQAVREAILGLKRGHAKQVPYVEVMQEHLNRDGILLSLLELLKSYPGQWSFENGDLAMNNEVILAQCHQLIGAVEKSEARIDALMKINSEMFSLTP